MRQRRPKKRYRARLKSRRTAPGFAGCGWEAANTTGRKAGPLSHKGNSRRITPPDSPLPRPVMISTQRTRSAAAWATNACKSAWARCTVRPCRSSVRVGGSLPVRNRDQVLRSMPPGAIPTRSGASGRGPGRANTAAGLDGAGAAGSGGSGSVTPSSGATCWTYRAHSARSCSLRAGRLGVRSRSFATSLADRARPALPPPPGTR